MKYTNFDKISAKGNTRIVSACFLPLYVSDVIQFRDDHARMRIRGPLEPVSCSKILTTR